MGDKQRAIELLAAEYRKEGLYGQVDHTYGAAARAAIAAITAAMCTAPVVVRLLDLLQQWEQQAAKAHRSDAMLINKHIRELGSVIRGENLLNQRGVAVVPNGPQVVPPAALGAHEVHPEAIHAGIDLGEAGESLVAADALEHASGVRQNCDGSATAPGGFVLVPVGVLRSIGGCAYAVSTNIDPRGYRWSEAYLDEALPHIRAALAGCPLGVKDAT